MKSYAYWAKRKAQKMYEEMEAAEEVAEEIAQAYSKASAYVNNQISGIFDRYKRKHHLTDKEARSLLNEIKDKPSFQKMLNQLKRGVPTEEKKELLAALESPAYRYRINRLEELQHNIDGLMQSVYQQERDISTKHYISASYDGYYQSIYDVQSRSGYGFSFASLSSERVDRLLSSRVYGLNYSETIWKNTQGLANTLKEELLLSVLTGKTEREVASELANKFATGASNARRLIRTESNYFYTQNELAGYEECGFENYFFIAVLDLKTSEICQQLDKKEFKLKNAQTGVNCPPMHPWCRSTILSGVTREELAQMQIRARDPKTGKNVVIPASMAYPEWLKMQQDKYGHTTINNLTKMVKNKKTDQAQYQKYKTYFKKDKDFKSFESFQQMKYNDVSKWNSIKQELPVLKTKQFLSDSGYDYARVVGKDIVVTARHPVQIQTLRHHAKENIELKSDRKAMTLENAQKIVDEAKVILYRKTNKTFKFVAEQGYSVLNADMELVTAVPQKWRKSYDKYLKGE